MQPSTNFFRKVSVLAAIVFLPVLAAASDSSLVPTNCATGNPCTYADFLNLINNVIHFVLFDLAVPLAVLSIAYAGFLYITAAGDTGKIGKAHDIFRKVIIGMILAFGAWLIVHAILAALGVSGNFSALTG